VPEGGESHVDGSAMRLLIEITDGVVVNLSVVGQGPE
jgi:hypothetical protein